MTTIGVETSRADLQDRLDAASKAWGAGADCPVWLDANIQPRRDEARHKNQIVVDLNAGGNRRCGRVRRMTMVDAADCRE